MHTAAPFTVQPVDEGFGAVEVIGLDPAMAGDADAAAALRAALATHAVVCVRQPQALDESEFEALVAMLGPIKDPVGRTKDGSTMQYGERRQIVDAGFVLTDELRAQLGDLEFGGLDSRRPGLFETFHTDDTFADAPAMATALHALELPSSPGGATTFLDMRAAYALLPDDERSRLVGMHVAYSYNNRDAFPPRVSAKGPYEQLVDVRHPLVRAHPVTGDPVLYLDLDRATHIDGLDERTGRALLQSLQDHAEANAPRYAHNWQPHDVVMWDNVAVQHKAAGDFPLGEPRRFWRFMVAGAPPSAWTPAS